MRKDEKPGRIGDYWLSTNRHGVWCRTWYDPATRQTRRATLSTRDFDEAVIALAEWIVLNQRIEKADPTDIPLLPILDRYHEHHGKKHTARGGEMSALAIAKAKAFFRSDETVAELTLDRQREFEADLTAKGHSAGYIGRIQAVIKAALNRAHQNHELVSVPYVRVLSAAKRTRVLTMQEAAALFNADPPEHMLMYLMLAFCTLSRTGEAIFDLQPFQVDLSRRLIHLNPPGREQTQKYRPTLPIVDTLLPWLQARRGQRYLVQYAKGQVQPIRSVKTAWRGLRERAGLGPDVIPYTIRHTMASELRRRGVPKWEVSGWLGHSAGTTDIYSHFAADYLAAGAAAIDDYFHELQPLVKIELRPANVVPISKGRQA